MSAVPAMAFNEDMAWGYGPTLCRYRWIYYICADQSSKSTNQGGGHAFPYAEEVLPAPLQRHHPRQRIHPAGGLPVVDARHRRDELVDERVFDAGVEQALR